MFLICVILIMVALISSGVSVIEREADDFSYFGRERTTFINGALILLIMLWHTSQHLPHSACWLDRTMSHFFFPGISQCTTVAPFLFFSGIGVYTSFSSKGTSYLRTLVRYRAFHLWLRFTVIVLIYCLWTVLQGHAMSWQKLFLALLAWKDYGNINWYIFVIISSYLLFALFFRIFKPQKAIIMLTVSVFLMVIFFKWGGQGRHWYLTPISFPAGVLFAWKKEQLHALILRVKHKIIAGCAICILAILAFHIPECVPYSRVVTANLASVAFCGGLLLLSAGLCVKRPNPFLVWCGSRAVFALLLAHMLPILLLERIQFFAQYHTLYILGCILLSFIGACMTLFVWEYTVDRLLVSRQQSTM